VGHSTSRLLAPPSVIIGDVINGCAEHIKEDPEDYYCVACDADQCPVCLAWFPDYEAFLEHMEAEGGDGE
jgi:hypothetical protein